MTQEEYYLKMSDMENKFACLFCDLEVHRCDMPRVGVCKICYAKAKKERSNKYENFKTWDVFLKLEKHDQTRS